MNKKVARAKYLEVKAQMANSLKAEANLRERVAHYLLKFQCAKNCLEKGRAKRARTKAQYLSAPKVLRIKTMMNTARDYYLRSVEELERVAQEGEWLRQDLGAKLKELELKCGLREPSAQGKWSSTDS